MSDFTEVDPAPYISGNAKGHGVGFSTPEGLECYWPYTSAPDAHTSVGCHGNIPGIPDSVPDDGSWGCGMLTQGAYRFQRDGGGCPPFDNATVLNAGQKISATNTTCVVGAGNLTACIDPIVNHGFVLQPSGSWVF